MAFEFFFSSKFQFKCNNIRGLLSSFMNYFNTMSIFVAQFRMSIVQSKQWINKIWSRSYVLDWPLGHIVCTPSILQFTLYNYYCGHQCCCCCCIHWMHCVFTICMYALIECAKCKWLTKMVNASDFHSFSCPFFACAKWEITIFGILV